MFKCAFYGVSVFLLLNYVEDFNRSYSVYGCVFVAVNQTPVSGAVGARSNGSLARQPERILFSSVRSVTSRALTGALDRLTVTCHCCGSGGAECSLMSPHQVNINNAGAQGE